MALMQNDLKISLALFLHGLIVLRNQPLICKMVAFYKSCTVTSYEKS